MAKTDNLDNDEVYDAIKNPLERPLEVANDYNKRSEIGTSKSIDKISKLEGDSSQGKIKSETDELVLSAIMVDFSSNSATHFLLKDKVDTVPAKDAESRVAKSMDAKPINEDIDNNHNNEY